MAGSAVGLLIQAGPPGEAVELPTCDVLLGITDLRSPGRKPGTCCRAEITLVDRG
jgi:hypothetical protein